MEQKYIIVAIRHLDFTGKEGERIVGDQIYLVGEADLGTGWQGDVCCVKAWQDALNPRIKMQFVPAVGDDVLCGYNRYGKINSIRPVQ